MILLSHPTANAFNCPLAEALHRAGRLAAFHTTLAFGRRRIALPRSLLRLHPWPECGRLVAQRLGLHALTHGWQSPLGADANWGSMPNLASTPMIPVANDLTSLTLLIAE